MYEMDEIINSIINGQRKQALRQLSESRFTFLDLIQELDNLNMSGETLRLVRVAENSGYISYNPANLRGY